MKCAAIGLSAGARETDAQRHLSQGAC